MLSKEREFPLSNFIFKLKQSSTKLIYFDQLQKIRLKITQLSTVKETLCKKEEGNFSLIISLGGFSSLLFTQIFNRMK